MDTIVFISLSSDARLLSSVAVAATLDHPAITYNRRIRPKDTFCGAAGHGRSAAVEGASSSFHHLVVGATGDHPRREPDVACTGRLDRFALLTSRVICGSLVDAPPESLGEGDPLEER